MAHLPFFPSIWTERDIQTWDSLDTPTWSIDQPSAWGTWYRTFGAGNHAITLKKG